MLPAAAAEKIERLLAGRVLRKQAQHMPAQFGFCRYRRWQLERSLQPVALRYLLEQLLGGFDAEFPQNFLTERRD
jgi:hypothetical protein